MVTPVDVETARSRAPSLLKSAATMPVGLGPTLYVLTDGLALVGLRMTVIELAWEFATRNVATPLPLRSASIMSSGWSPAWKVSVGEPNEKPGVKPVLETCVGLSMTSEDEPEAVTIDVSTCEEPVSVARSE